MREDERMTTHALPVTPGAEPFSVDGGPIGVLLIHGFTGSPASMSPWGQQLADAGYTVRVPRLPGHGTSWQDLNTTRWANWYGEVDATLTEMRRRCTQVVVAGLSMGGCLALRLAQQRPGEVDALILVNPAVNLSNKQLLVVPVLRFLLPAMPGIGNDIKKPGMDETGYDKTPLHALHSQLQMWKDVRDNIGRVTQPLLFFRSPEDHVVDETSLEIIMSGVSSAQKQTILLRNSYHVATLDNDAELIVDESARFISEHVGAAHA